MSALARPSEVLLVAFFDAAGGAEAAARAFLHSGLDADHVTILARQSRGAAFQAVPRVLSLRLAGVGRVVARGALAAELRAQGAVGSAERLPLALRGLGLSLTDAPLVARGVQAKNIVVLAAVPREEASGWGRMLRDAGAVSLAARARLGPWSPKPAVRPPLVGRRRGGNEGRHQRPARTGWGRTVFGEPARSGRLRRGGRAAPFRFSSPSPRARSARS